MKYFAPIPGVICLALTAACIAACVRRRGEAGERLVHLPFYVALVGTFMNLICIPLTHALWQDDASELYYLLLLAAGWLLQLGYLNCWIRYDDYGFTHSNLLGVRRQYSYEDVVNVDRRNYRYAAVGHDLWLRVGSRRVLIDQMQVNREDFLKTLGKRVKKSKWTEPERRSWDPYGHNVPQPDGWILFVVITLLLAAFLVLIAILAADVLGPADSPENTTLHELSFSSYETKSGQWHLTGSDGQTYRLDCSTEEYGLDPAALCSGGVYRIYAGSHDRIEAIRTQRGEELLSFAQFKTLSDRNERPAIPILSALLLVLCLLHVAMIKTARHPERCPHWFRKLLWQDGYLLSDGGITAEELAKLGK